MANPFTNAHIESAGSVRGTDERAYNLFKIGTADDPPLYGAYSYVFPDEKVFDFNIEIGLFGYVDPDNLGNLHPQARKHFGAEECLTIEQLIRSYFLSEPEIFAKRWPPPARFAGGVAFRPNWIVRERPETSPATGGTATVQSLVGLVLTALRRLRGDS